MREISSNFSVDIFRTLLQDMESGEVDELDNRRRRQVDQHDDSADDNNNNNDDDNARLVNSDQSSSSSSPNDQGLIFINFCLRNAK